MPMPFAEWRPDIALLDNQFAGEAENVFAGANSYMPFPSLAPFTLTHLPSAGCGLYSARTSDRRLENLRRLRAPTVAGPDRLGRCQPHQPAAPITWPTGDLWRFAQFGSMLVAVNETDNPQVIDVDRCRRALRRSGRLAAAGHQRGGRLAIFCCCRGCRSIIGKIIWSSINDITRMDHRHSICATMQEFPDGGPVQGVVGGEIGYVVQDRGIRTMQFLPGDTTFIFNFSRVLHDRGCDVEIRLHLASAMCSTSCPRTGSIRSAASKCTPIGADKVNDWFLRSFRPRRRNVVHCIVGVNKPRIVLGVHTQSSEPAATTS